MSKVTESDSFFDFLESGGPEVVFLSFPVLLKHLGIWKLS